MAVGLVAGYGLGAAHVFRYLIPRRKQKNPRELFVGMVDAIAVGESLWVKDPQGQQINVVRTAVDIDHPEDGFLALSGKCPHLGCRVHWDANEDCFVCPCHRGSFDKEGIALAGPPKKEGKNLPKDPVRVSPKTGCVFVVV